MARKSSSRFLPSNVKIKMEGRPPPDEAGASSIPDNLQENFSNLNIGTRKKDNLATYDIKENDIPSEEDIDVEDVNILENWNSLDRVTIDGSESSEWGRSISSSLSWFDETEQEATLKVKGMMDNIEKVLYGEVHTPLPKPLMDECHQWRQRFPHLRVVGVGLGNSLKQKVDDDQSSSEDESAHTIVGSINNSREGLDEGKEADEEIIACHGKIEMLPVLSHEFQNQHEPVKDEKIERIKQRLLNEVTSIIWKEVVIPALKPVVDKIIEEKNHIPTPKSSNEEETCDGALRIEEQDELSSALKSVSNPSNQSCMSLSAREARTMERLPDSFDDPLEFYRRHSEQHIHCESQFKNELASYETATKVERESTKSKGNGRWLTNRKRKERFQERLSCYNDDDLDRRTSKINSPKEDRNVISSRGPTRIGVVEELKPLEKPMAWSKSKNDGLQNSGKCLPPKQNRKLTLPAIDHGKLSTYIEPNLPSYVRSSSALPKLGPNNIRSSLSPYDNKTGKISRGRKNTSKYNQADPLELRTETTYRRISQLQPGPSEGMQDNNTTRSKRTRDLKFIGSSNVRCDES